MKYFNRLLEKSIPRLLKYPILAFLGPRQSGKSTLAKHFFKKHTFLNLEDRELQEIAKADPKGFLRAHENEHGIILDEFQNCPDLLSTIQVISDDRKRPGYFILTCSQNFLMNQAISQSLAGRVGILTLLPFSLNEMTRHGLVDPDKPEDFIYKGGYPRLFESQFDPKDLYPPYIQTYVERDVRQILNVKNLSSFNLFLKLCAARIGQLINFSDIANHCNVSVPTIHQWFNILEASYVSFLLKPYWENFNKRVTKTPKLYFYDTGLACSLLGLNSSQSVLHSSHYGHLFENAIIADLHKQYYNAVLPAPLYFWRDKNGTIEVDCLIDKGNELIPIEIKSGESYQDRYFAGIHKWKSLADRTSSKSYVIYGGTKSMPIRDTDQLLSWKEAGTFLGEKE